MDTNAEKPLLNRDKRRSSRLQASLTPARMLEPLQRHSFPPPVSWKSLVRTPLRAPNTFSFNLVPTPPATAQCGARASFNAPMTVGLGTSPKTWMAMELTAKARGRRRFGAASITERLEWEAVAKRRAPPVKNKTRNGPSEDWAVAARRRAVHDL